MRTGYLSVKPIALSCAAIVATACPISAFARTEHGSFLETRAKTVHELVLELNDPRVLGRYERHFGMEKRQLQDLFRSLKLGTLKRSGRYVVYNADNAGRINWKTLKLRKGALVFADRSGVPVLKFSCGNPMKSGSDKLASNSELSGLGEPQDQLRQDLGATNSTASDLMVGPVAPAIPTIEIESPTIADISPTDAPMAFNASSPGSGNNYGGLLLFGAVAPVGLVISNPRGHKSAPVESTPEPASAMILGCGAGVLMFRRSKRRQA